MFEGVDQRLSPSFAGSREEPAHEETRPEPNSYFMDVKCPGCYQITTMFSPAQAVVPCVGCSTVLCPPTEGKVKTAVENVGEQETAFI